MALMQTPFVTAEEIDALCSYEKIIDNQRQVFKNYYLNEAVMGPRAILSQNENAQFSYIARASKNGPTVIKFGSVVPSNSGKNIPVVQTTVAILDTTTGSVKLFLDGEAVTKWRTVCASMAAASTLANQVKNIAVIGLGHQGIAHIQAAKSIFNPERIIGISKSAKTVDLGFEIEVSKEINEVNKCDLIFICTNSSEPVIKSLLNPGSTCISIGSFSPTRLEVSVDALSKADKVFGDDAKTISEQSGSVLSTLAKSDRKWTQAQSIGGVYAEKIKGRENEQQVIYYFSVGLGIQDAALAEYILENGKF
ncbi:MAG: ornithine cyclodeaminase family protein [Candidatus Nanopelagicaceae bacterium]|nr:ornithine cyclodeaminase family protein [Candidatus Nanopelagicaceae bacterium]